MDNKKICIIDYNSGNTGSVFNILKFLNYNLVYQIKITILLIQLI